MPKKGAARPFGVFLYKAGVWVLPVVSNGLWRRECVTEGVGGRLGRERAWRGLRTSAVSLGACAEVARSGYTGFENEVTQIKILSF